MSVFELFRRFFHPPGTRDPFFGGMIEDEDDEEDDDFFLHSPGFCQEPPSWRTRPPVGDPFGFDDMFRDFNELFADFGSMIRDVPRLPGAEPPLRTPGGSAGSLRDFMLKCPDSHLPRQHPSAAPGPHAPLRLPGWPSRWREDNAITSPPGDIKQDKILDSEFSSRGLDSILRLEEQSPPPPSSYFRSVSVSRVMKPDGTVEERRTVRDSEGNSTTTVTVTGDDPPTAVDETLGLHRSLPDLSDSQTILSRLLQRWFSN
ncbi:HCLS1-associated protein X-1 [Phyllobates terribilis]|uniref:HCLS1-associated protein X-1 n=1 Tax=Phyllobates terribilis TaxID=111132 RepID=UPI003CCAB93B